MRALALTFVVCAALALLSMIAFDRDLVQIIHTSVVASSTLFVQGTRLLDAVSGRHLLHSHALSALLLGTSLVGLGFLGWLRDRRSYAARALLFTGGVQLATIGASAMLKHLFGRLRPPEAMAHGWQHLWFAGGDSFPSGHVAFFFGLFLPLAYLFPRHRLPLLIVPVFIALARLDESVHFLSDVLGSIALAALITWLAALTCRRCITPLAAAPR
jgi:membrane-associated phospholipid phosphatase